MIISEEVINVQLMQRLQTHIFILKKIFKKKTCKNYIAK